MKISGIKPYNLNATNINKKPFLISSFCANKTDKREIIDDLIRQRNYIKTLFGDATLVPDYLCYAKNTNEIEPVKQIRKALFEKKSLKKDKEILFMDRITERSIIPQDITLFRCCTPFDFGLPISTKDFLDTFFEEGKYFRIPVYPRTTLRKNFAKYYAREMKKNTKDKPMLFKIFVPKGAKGIYADELPDILPRVISQVEEEIILPRNSIFRFRTRSEHSNYEQVEMDLIKSFWQVPLLKKIHNFNKELNLPPVEVEIKPMKI